MADETSGQPERGVWTTGGAHPVPTSSGHISRAASTASGTSLKERAKSLWSRASSAVTGGRLSRTASAASDASKKSHESVQSGSVPEQEATVQLQSGGLGRATSLTVNRRRLHEQSDEPNSLSAWRFERSRSEGTAARPGDGGSRQEQMEAYQEAQTSIALKFELWQVHAAHVLQRSVRCHASRKTYKEERFVQLEHPANIIVGGVRNYRARRLLNYYKRVLPSVFRLKSAWRLMQCRRRLQLFKFVESHPEAYRPVSKSLLDAILYEHFETVAQKVTNDWAAKVLCRSFRCHQARHQFWTRFDIMDELEDGIGLEMTAPILIQSFAVSIKWAEVNAAAARIQSCIRVPEAVIYRQDLQDYDNYIKESATILQCAWRCFWARERLLMWDTPKCHAAALRVQLAYRCCLDREKLMTRQEEFRIETENSIIIQTVARVWIAKRRFATRSLDVEWPTASLRNPDGSYALSMRAALTVQRVFKGHDARHRLRCYILSAFILTNVEVEVETRTASTRIQKAWRCHVARSARTEAQHKSYGLLLERLRNRRRVHKPSHLVNHTAEAEQDESAMHGKGKDTVLGEERAPGMYGRQVSHFSANIRWTKHQEKTPVQCAEMVKRVYRAHVVRSNIRAKWGWDHREVAQALMVQWHRRQATKRIQSWWRLCLERFKILQARQQQIQQKEEIEAQFNSDPALRRVRLLNKEIRVRLTAVEESHGTRVGVEMDASAELWSQVFDGQPAVWRVYRDDNQVLCRVILLTVHTPRDSILEVSSTVVGLKPSLICTPGWAPPHISKRESSKVQPLVAEKGLSMTTVLRMAARAGPNPSGFELRDYTKPAQLSIVQPSLFGEIFAKEKGAVKIMWKSSPALSTFLRDSGIHKVHSVEIMLMRRGEEYLMISAESPNSGTYNWNVAKQVHQSGHTGDIDKDHRGRGKLNVHGLRWKNMGDIRPTGGEELTANGLKWQNIGTTQPQEGRDLKCPPLQRALMSKTEFTDEEWAAFDIEDLCRDHFIQSVPGVKWKDVGSQKPSTGTEIQNKVLALELQRRLDFSPEELDHILIASPSLESYIKVNGTYFKPDESVVSYYKAGIKNTKLAEALKTKTEFTPAEWGMFDIHDLRMDHYIKSGTSFFSPSSFGYKDGVWLRGNTENLVDFERRIKIQKSLRAWNPATCAADGSILKREEVMQFMEPEYQIRVRVKSLHNGDPLFAPTAFAGPDYIESFSPHFFIVHPKPQKTESRKTVRSTQIRLLFPRGADLLWTIGLPQTIKWQTEGFVHSVRVSLLSAGEELTTIAETVANIGHSGVLIYKMPRIALFGLRYTPDGRVRGGTKRPVHYFDSARSAASALCVSIDSVAECCRANKNDLDVEFGLVRLDGTPYFCCDMPLGDHYQVRICSKQDKTVKAESAFFRVVDPVTSNSESTYRVDGGIATSLDNKVNTMTAPVRLKMIRTLQAFGEPAQTKAEARRVGTLSPLDLQLDRTDGSVLTGVPNFVRKKVLRPSWDQGRGPNKLLSSFKDCPEVQSAGDRNLFDVFRPRTGPDNLERWSKDQEANYGAWRMQKIKKVMADSGIEGEVRDWKDLMQEWEMKNNPEMVKLVAEEKEKADREMAASQSLDLWEMMRERYKGDKRSDSLEDRAALGASSILEEQRSREATEAEVKAKSQAEALKLKQSRDVAKKSAKFVRLDDGAIEETRRVTSDLINSLYNKSIDPRKKKALEKLKSMLESRLHERGLDWTDTLAVVEESVSLDDIKAVVASSAASVTASHVAAGLREAHPSTTTKAAVDAAASAAESAAATEAENINGLFNKILVGASQMGKTMSALQAQLAQTERAVTQLKNKGSRFRATAAPDAPYNLQAEKEWQALGKQEFLDSKNLSPKNPWQPYQLSVSLNPPGRQDQATMNQKTMTERSPPSRTKLSLYRKLQPGSWALGVSDALASRQRQPNSRAWDSDNSDSVRILPLIRPESTASVDSGTATSHTTCTEHDEDINDRDQAHTLLVETEGACQSQDTVTADDASEEFETRPSTSGSGSSNPSLLGLDKKEIMSKSNLLAVSWAKKTLRRSRAETKEQNAFREAQVKNMQPIKHRRHRLFDYQLQKFKEAAEVSPTRWGGPDTSTSGFSFSDSWLPAERKHRANFVTLNKDEVDVAKMILDQVEMDKERSLNLDHSLEAGSRPSRLDFDPSRMLGDTGNKLDPDKAAQRKEAHEKHRVAFESRRSTNRSRPTTGA